MSFFLIKLWFLLRGSIATIKGNAAFSIRVLIDGVVQ
jgi:hypothetical protein